MKTLSTVIKGKGNQEGYSFHQVKREGEFAIYKREPSQRQYEVIKIRERKASSRTINGREVNYEAKEIYPTCEEFGRYGYAVMGIEQAERVFNNAIATGKLSHVD